MYIQIVMYNYFNGKTSMNALGDRLASLCSSDSAGRRSLERSLG